MFRLLSDEHKALRSQIATSKDGRGGRMNVFDEDLRNYCLVTKAVVNRCAAEKALA